ncbi:lysophospholipase L1-like esterase [Actinocorallia herbida]|uniref:Lysophospholipase L1-like esterase n=1 Tax=Actinocorallia herbida TaxID=58109 RepID=A0A3N1D1A6_9ACTN|nr:FG-GAP-like repeat-containing protein [Actinocorallia herbida]ROO87313.1 lysophospholipase L1-like esterase [Actinocorallia herbida]
MGKVFALRRRWRCAAVVVALVGAVIAGEAVVVPRPAVAAPAGDFVLDVPIADFDRPAAEAAFAQAYDSMALDAFLDDMRAAPEPPLGAGAPAGGLPPLDLPDHVPGTMEITDTGLRLVIPADELQAMAEPYVNQMITAAAGFAAGGIALIGCFALTENAYVCKGLAGAAALGTARFVAAKLSGEDTTTLKFWGTMFAAIIVGTALGLGTEWITVFAKANSAAMFTAIGEAIWSFVEWLGSWASAPIRTIAAYLRVAFRTIGTDLPEAIDIELGRIGHRAPGLSVMPLGDSITAGWGSSSGAGYRSRLYAKLNSAGDLDFVGTVRGSGTDADHQGHPGARIDQIRYVADCSVPSYRPNVIALMAGTNDLNQNHDVAGAPQRLVSLVDRLLALRPGTTVLVSTLPPSTKTDVGPRVTAYNNAIRPLIRAMEQDGKRVRLAELPSITTADLADQLHPDNDGHAKIANGFAKAFYQALDDGIITSTALPSGSAPGSDCAVPAEEVPGGWTNHGKIYEMPASAAAEIADVHLADVTGDGRADRVAVSGGAVAVRAGTGTGFSASVQAMAGAPAGRLVFANVVGDAAADLVLVGDDGRLTAWRNARDSSGTPRFTSAGVIAPGVGDTGARLRLADVNGDGRDDYVVVSDDSKARAWLNTPGDDDVPSWYSWGEIASGTGVAGSTVRFADFDADGRDDYVTVADDGALRVWRNTAGDGGRPSWSSLGAMAVGAAGASREALRLADLDADGDGDYALAGADGSLRAWRYDGPNQWVSLGTAIPAEPAAAGSSTAFADMNGDGWDDPVRVTGGKVEGALSSAPNPAPNLPALPARGTFQVLAPGTGNPGRTVLADVNGDDRDDYLLVGAAGEVDAWLNTPGNGGVPSWSSWGRIAPGTGASGTRIRFSDIDGDGRDDYLVMADNGAVEAWRNTPGNGGKPSWSHVGVWAVGVGGASPANVRFADVDGDGRADYLKVADNGAVDVWLNRGGDTGGGWQNRGTWAVGVNGATLSSVLFPDLDADGLADYVHMHGADLYGWTSKGGN